MTLSYMTSASFNQNPSKARQAANENPLVITDHGKPTHVLLTYAEFEAKWAKPKSALEALRDPNPATDDDFDPPRMDFEWREVEF